MRGRSSTGPSSSWGMVLDAPDPRALARFYAALLGWVTFADEPGWVTLAADESGRGYLGFHGNPSYVPPVWPPVEGRQQMMAHLDIEVDDLDLAVEDALAAGATLAAHQPQDGVRVLLDPVGHPFCLYVGSG